jgi:hypothetical protein
MCCRSPRCALTTLGITCARFRRRNRGFGTGRRARTHTHTLQHSQTQHRHTRMHARMNTDPTHALAHTQLRAARRVTWSTGRAAVQSAAHNARATCTGHTMRSTHGTLRGTGFTPPTSAPGPGSPRPHLRRDWAHPRPHLRPGPGRIRAGRLGAPVRPVLLASRPVYTGACVSASRAHACKRCERACVRACVDARARVDRVRRHGDERWVGLARARAHRHVAAPAFACPPGLLYASLAFCRNSTCRSIR